MSTDYPFITPPPSDADRLASSELRALALVWHDRRDDLEASGALTDFRQRLEREWAIETGLIERLYTWERGVTEVLISQGVDAAIIAHNTTLDRPDADRVAALIIDQQSVIRGLYDLVTAEQPLTEHGIRSMHQVMTASQEATDAIDEAGNRHRIPLLRGAYKERPNNPRRLDGTMHVYCPPEHVTAEMGNLIQWHHDAEATDLPPEVISAWLHHRFTQIHPFQDGNGRIARALASLVFLKARLFPLVIRDLDRRAYIGALEAADAGDLAPLVDLFADRQRAAILAALDQRPPEERLPEQVFLAAIRQRKARTAREASYAPVLELAQRLANYAEHRIDEFAELANHQLREFGADYRADTFRRHAEDEPLEGHITSVHARLFDYGEAPEAHIDRVRLAIKTAEHFVTSVDVHQRIEAYDGTMAITATTYRLFEPTRRGLRISEIEPFSTDPFQFNYRDDPDAAEERFRPWLEDTIALALRRWRDDPGL